LIQHPPLLATFTASTLALAALLAAPACSSPASTGSVVIRIDNVASARGTLMIALCDRASFMKRSCPIRARVPARRGTVSVRLAKVPAGQWAVEVFHDENANGQLDRNGLGIPVEGVGFSRDARGQYGPPAFDQAAVLINGATTIAVPLNY